MINQEIYKTIGEKFYKEEKEPLETFLRREINRIADKIGKIKLDGVVKSPIYCVAAIFQTLNILYVCLRS